MLNYDDVIKNIGSNLRAERIRKHYTQEEFAELASVHRNYIGKIERGEQNLTIKKIVRLVNTLEIPIEKIF